ncbi:MAG TPA: IscS subfamily cysteine desulfurase [Pseudogracilibacillus sp.]|nr:IscS subfamily cysteine desulfurase [Pseudogracilibacillus sp.]
MVYLDYAATTPMRSEALEAYVEAAKKYFGNESSLHNIGYEAEELLKKCRHTFAHLLKVEAEGIYFTSSGSEANVLTLLSILKGNEDKKHIMTTKAEHASLYHLFEQLKEEGYEVSYLPLNKDGIVTVDILKTFVREDTVLFASSHVNPEVGGIQPIEAIGRFLQKENILFHVDCVQSFGECDIPVQVIDSLAISAHKIYGPKGCGLAYIRPGVSWQPVYDGTTHERGFKPGTVDLPAITAFTIAAQLACQEMVLKQGHYLALRSYLEKRLVGLERVRIIECGSQLPQIVGLTLAGMEGQYTLLSCNEKGIAISTGTACSVSMQDPSRTMLALGYDEDVARQFVRISFGKETSQEDLDLFVAALEQLVYEYV